MTDEDSSRRHFRERILDEIARLNRAVERLAEKLQGARDEGSTRDAGRGTEITVLQGDVGRLQADVAALQGRVDRLQTAQAAVAGTDDVTVLASRVVTLETQDKVRTARDRWIALALGAGGAGAVETVRAILGG